MELTTEQQKIVKQLETHLRIHNEKFKKEEEDSVLDVEEIMEKDKQAQEKKIANSHFERAVIESMIAQVKKDTEKLQIDVEKLGLTMSVEEGIITSGVFGKLQYRPPYLIEVKQKDSYGYDDTRPQLRIKLQFKSVILPNDEYCEYINGWDYITEGSYIKNSQDIKRATNQDEFKKRLQKLYRTR